MICPHCRNQIEEGSVFCGYCGAKVDQAGVSPQNEPPEKAPPMGQVPPIEQVSPTPSPYNGPSSTMYVDETESRRGGSKTVLIVSIICAAVVALALIFVFLLLPAIQDNNKSGIVASEDDIEDIVKEKLEEAQGQIDDPLDGKGAGEDDILAEEAAAMDDPEPSPTPMPTASPTQPPTPTPTQPPTPTPAPTPYYIIPGSDYRYITMSDLDGLSKSEVQLARNELYARYGYNFHTDWIQDYFEDQAWYVNDLEYGYNADSPLLNSYERANAAFIKDYEKSKGWTD